MLQARVTIDYEQGDDGQTLVEVTVDAPHTLPRALLRGILAEADQYFAAEDDPGGVEFRRDDGTIGITD